MADGRKVAEPRNINFYFRVSEKEYQQLCELAEYHHTTKSRVLRSALYEYYVPLYWIKRKEQNKQMKAQQEQNRLLKRLHLKPMENRTVKIL